MFVEISWLFHDIANWKIVGIPEKVFFIYFHFFMYVVFPHFMTEIDGEYHFL